MSLIANAIHLWWADSRTCPRLVAADYHAWFTQAEQQALAQKIPPVREQALFTKCFLKSILSRYVAQAPQELLFDYNAYGKPCLVSRGLQFNLSHSDHYVVLAICRDVAVGIDIQTMRQKLTPLSIAKRFFHEREYSILKALSAEAQRSHFYRLWSAKEAVLKAFGVGIGATGLRDIVFKTADDGSQEAGLVWQIDFAASSALFHMVSLQELFWLPNCAFSLATCQAALAPQVFQWQGPCDVSSF